MNISSVSDAVAAAKYLLDKGVLCQKCGLELVSLVNEYYKVCAGCRPKHGEFKEVRCENVFDRSLCEALRSYVLQKQDSGAKVLGEGGQDG